MDDWDAVHRRTVETFRAGGAAAGPTAWDDFIDQRSEMVQPMLENGTGAPFWSSEISRALRVMPDLRADVLGWSGSDDRLFIQLRFQATVGGRDLTWDAVDLLHLRPDGSLIRRESFFDSAPVTRALATRPRTWWAWWWSGLWPWAGRRRLTDRLSPGRDV